MKIVNKKKFVRSMLIIIGVIVSILFFINTTSFSHSEIEYKTVYISDGDTLWSIAREEQEENDYFTGKDIRDIISIIKTTNKLSTSNLSVNQKLSVPII